MNYVQAGSYHHYGGYESHCLVVVEIQFVAGDKMVVGMVGVLQSQVG